MADLGYDRKDYEPRKPFEPIPEGIYSAHFTETEIKPTKANDGSMRLCMTAEVLNGKYKGRKVFVNLNIRNNNPNTEKWARETVESICEAVGTPNMRDPTELERLPFMMKVKLKKGQDSNRNDRMENEVVEFINKSHSVSVDQPDQGDAPWKRRVDA